ncbi:MAG: hypothetical protein LBH62_01650 [Nitrososphaerota archaeon]|jgi:hypothetical protein|nr:hypothetical protein [Nitrososphaerota archaeon]
MSKRFLFLVFFSILSVLLAIFTITTVSIPFTSISDFGVASQLPWFYWGGLLVVLTMLFIARSSKKGLSIIFLLLVLYLFIIPSVVQENATLLGLSYPAAEGQQLVDSGKLSEDLNSIYKYHNFPGFIYFTAILSSLTGIPLALICKFAPSFLTTLIAVIVYLILRTKLNYSFSIMGSLWFLASWWWVAGNYFSPQAVAFVLFALVFLIFTKFAFNPKTIDRSLLIVAIIFSTTIIFTHAFTSIMLLSCFIPLLFFNRKNKGVILSLFLVTFAVAYFVLRAYPFTEWALTETSQGMTTLFSFQFRRAQLGGSISQNVTNTFRYALMFPTVFVFFASAFYTLKKKFANVEKYWLIAIIGMALPIFVTAYGMSETIIRVFMFALIPLSYICVKFLAKKPKVLTLLLCLLILCNVPAHYGGSTVEGVASSEIAGAIFYVEHVPSQAPYYSLTSKTTYLMLYSSPYSVKMPTTSENVLLPINSDEKFNAKLYQFVLYSQADVNQFLYYHDKVPLNETKLVNFDKFYDNPFITLYTNSTYVTIL